MSKDLWMEEEERIEEEFCDAEIDRGEAESRLKVLGFDPHEIKAKLDEIQPDHDMAKPLVPERFEGDLYVMLGVEDWNFGKIALSTTNMANHERSGYVLIETVKGFIWGINPDVDVAEAIAEKINKDASKIMQKAQEQVDRMQKKVSAQHPAIAAVTWLSKEIAE